MKNSKVFCIYLFIFIIGWTAYGQIEFEYKEYDFGEILEKDGAVEHTFYFMNQGDAPVHIANVKASCGCTTPAWTKTPVAPGDSGFVVARFDPLNRPGVFRKSLNVTTTAGMYTLYVEGKVRKRAKKIESELPHKSGNLRMKSNYLPLGTLTNNQSWEVGFEVFNDGTAPLEFYQDSTEASGFIRVKIDPEVLVPDGSATVHIIYDPVVQDDLGYYAEQIRIHTNDEIMPIKTLNLSVTVVEYFGDLDKETLARAPRLVVDRGVYEFGYTTEGSIIEAEFILTNEGFTPLEIRKLESNCGCLTARTADLELMPGERVAVFATFDTQGRKGRQSKTLSIFSNDPVSPTQMITIRGEVRSLSN